MAAELSVLNVGTGDTTLSFDKDKPAERERAALVVTDMLKRGFVILVQVGEKDGKPLYQRAESFDPQTCEYIVAGAPPDTKVRSGARRKKASKHRLSAADTPAVSVARSAGG